MSGADQRSGTAQGRIDVDGVTPIVTCMTDAERPYLDEALRSVHDQTRPPARILLCVEQGNSWLDQVDGDLLRNVDVLRLPLAYLGTIRNEALAHVTTPLVAFLDGDDAWHPDKLHDQVSALTRDALDVVATKHLLVRDDGKGYFFGFARSVPMPSSWLGRTSVFRDRPFEDVALAEDVLLWRRLEAEVPWRVLNRFLLRYRVREGSLSSLTWSKQRKVAYARRSALPGVRFVLLAASYAANVGLGLSDWTARRLRGKHRGWGTST
jgi:glycosyltransferase involved in cell wall biosynthesis